METTEVVDVTLDFTHNLVPDVMSVVFIVHGKVQKTRWYKLKTDMRSYK